MKSEERKNDELEVFQRLSQRRTRAKVKARRRRGQRQGQGQRNSHQVQDGDDDDFIKIGGEVTDEKSPVTHANLPTSSRSERYSNDEYTHESL